MTCIRGRAREPLIEQKSEKMLIPVEDIPLPVFTPKKSIDRSFLAFLEACNFQVPKCEKCEKKARFLATLVCSEGDGQNIGLGVVEFYRVCLDHLTPDIGCDIERNGSVVVIDLEGKVELPTFSPQEIRAVKKKYETRMDYRVAFNELVKFAKMSIEHDQKESKHQEHIKRRADMLEECKIDEGTIKTWPEYYDTLLKLFECCGWEDEKCSQLGCGALICEVDEYEYFSDYSIELYEQFYHATNDPICEEIIGSLFSDATEWRNYGCDELPNIEIKEGEVKGVEHEKIAVEELKKYTKMCIENDRKFNDEVYKKMRSAIENKASKEELDMLGMDEKWTIKDLPDYNEHLKHMEMRTKTFEECKDDLETMFYCCSRCVYDEKDSYTRPISEVSCIEEDEWYEPCKKCREQMFEIFSPESITIYHELFQKLVELKSKHSAKNRICLHVLGEIFGWREY